MSSSMNHLVSPNDPLISYNTGYVRCDSLRTKANIYAYSLLGGLIARHRWRGGRWLRRHMLGSLEADFAVMRFSEDAVLRFQVKDSYWNRLLLRGFEYEMPLASLFQRLKDHDYSLIDCGANLGFWSVLVSSKALGAKRVLAIEALKSNFELLQANRDLNGHRFECWHRAVYSVAGEAIDIYGDAGTHYGVSVRQDWHNAKCAGRVTTTTIDEAARHLRMSGGQIAIKLDVEGAEVEALDGAIDTLASGALLIYEDHPRDYLHKPTAYLLERGLQVRLLTAERSVPIRDPQALTVEKRRGDYEYNLVAFSAKSQFASLFDD